MTLIGDDRPGLVEALAQVVADHGGNWLESRMCHLGGAFAGILRVQVSAAEELSLESALRSLQSEGLTVLTRSEGELAPEESHSPTLLDIIGQDRPGIVRQISSMLARENINVEELHTERISAPMSGEMLFKARIYIRIPPNCDPVALRQNLEKIGGDMQVDVTLNSP